MNSLEDPILQKAFSDGVSAAFLEVFGEEGIQLLGGKFDVFRVAQTGDGELVVVGLRLSAKVKRSPIKVPVLLPGANMFGALGGRNR